MSCMSLAKKLLPAKKAWKSFASKIHSQLRKLNISKASRKSSRRLRSLCHVISRKTHALTQRLPGLHRRNHHHHQYKGISPIYADQLFADPLGVHAAHTPAPAEASKAKDVAAASSSAGKGKAENAAMAAQQHNLTLETTVIEEKGLPRKSRAGEKSIYNVDDAWKAAVASLPQLRGVDEKAEEFISNFREEMKLQREKSILDFQEMLARGA